MLLKRTYLGSHGFGLAKKGEELPTAAALCASLARDSPRRQRP